MKFSRFQVEVSIQACRLRADAGGLRRGWNTGLGLRAQESGEIVGSERREFLLCGPSFGIAMVEEPPRASARRGRLQP